MNANELTKNRITSDYLKRAVKTDPSWASKLTVPVEITDYCNMARSKITHLSPLLHFSGRNKEGECANFSRCLDLKVAEGSFAGFVNFDESGVEKIGDLNITAYDQDGYAASFADCPKLKVAEGIFPGYVGFSNSGIEQIGKLHIASPDTDGNAASFDGCPKLKVAEGTFPGAVSFSDSGIERIQGLVIHTRNKNNIAADFADCTFLQRAPVSLLGDSSYLFDDEFRLRAAEMQAVRMSACTALKNQPDLEI